MRNTTALVLLVVLGCGGRPLEDDVESAAVPYLLEPATRIAAGGVHTCAVRSGALECWGDHSLGQLGIGLFLKGGLPPGCTEPQAGYVECERPVAVPGLGAGVTKVAAGFAFTCAVLTDGTVRCFGSNLYGQLGIGGGTPPGCIDSHSPIVGVYCTLPVTVPGLAGAVDVSAGEFHACAKLSDGTARCWGLNLHGQLGIGYAHPAECQGSTGEGLSFQCDRPVAVPGLAGIRAIAAAPHHTCAVLGNGTARCFGVNGSGELGIGTALPAGCQDFDRDGIAELCPSPVAVSGLSGGVSISGGGAHTCALLGTGEGRCWGSNVFGQLGIGASMPAGCTEIGNPNGLADICRLPVPVSGLSGASSLRAGWIRTFAVAGGAALGWGSDDRRALGVGSPLPPACSPGDGIAFCPVPVPLPGLESGTFEVVTNEIHSCAALANGGARCWGTNGYGVLGVGHTVPPGCTDSDGDGRADVCPTAVSVVGL